MKRLIAAPIATLIIVIVAATPAFAGASGGPQSATKAFYWPMVIAVMVLIAGVILNAFDAEFKLARIVGGGLLFGSLLFIGASITHGAFFQETRTGKVDQVNDFCAQNFGPAPTDDPSYLACVRAGLKFSGVKPKN